MELSLQAEIGLLIRRVNNPGRESRNDAFGKDVSTLQFAFLPEVTMVYHEHGDATGFNRILFATDFSTASDAAFEYAVSIATRYCAQLYAVHVIDSEPFDLVACESPSSVLAQVEEEARQKIECMLTTRGLPEEQCHIIVIAGALPQVLTDIMRREEIDLAVLGTHGRRAFEKFLMGSVDEEVFHTAPCPVLTIGPKTAPSASSLKLRHVLYPVEFAPDPSEAAKYAVSLAETYGAKLTIMNVSEDMSVAVNERECFPMPTLSWIDDHIPKGSGLRNRVYFERGFGPAADSILEFASDAGVDLIVLGIQQMDSIIAAHLRKRDTAYELASRAPCPVLSIR